MKILILTLPFHTNYGGLLQSYALQTVLKKQGHNVITCAIPSLAAKSVKGKFILILRKIYLSMVDKDGYFLHLWKRQSPTSIITQNTKVFIDKYLNTIEYNTPKKGTFDAIVVGSDQVWRPMYADTKIAFLSFAEKWNDIHRVAYAASFGSEDWEYNDEQEIQSSRLAKLFDGISVREKSGVRLCKEQLGVDAVHVLDPTMLLTSEDYIANLHLEKQEPSEGDMFYYFLDSNEDKMIFSSQIADRLNLTAFTVNSNVEDSNAPICEKVHPNVEKWLRAFYDSKFIVTDSFHGCVFSLIFNKPFIAIGNKKRGLARFLSLFEICGQEHRLVTIDSLFDIDIKDYIKNPNPDYTIIKQHSLDFINKFL